MQTHARKILSSLLLWGILAPLSALAKPQPLDNIAAIVNDAVITQSMLNKQIDDVRKKMETGAVNPRALEKQVLEQLILKEVQLGFAKKTGIHVDEIALDNAIENIAKQHNISLTQLRQAILAEGMDFNDYRQNIREQMIIAQLQQRDVLSGLQISEQEITHFLHSPAGLGEMTTEYRVGHILLALSDAPTPEEITAVTQKAKEIVAKLEQGQDFATLALAESSGQQALEGGDLGWRKLAQLPTIFVQPVAASKVNGVLEPIRSNSGIHIVKLLDKRTAAQAQTLTNTALVRHILIKTNATTSDKDAEQRLHAIREKIQKGEDFAQLAKTHSADLGSANNGGSVGWVTPDVLVPEFSAQVNKLGLQEISAPFKTSFGWHIVQVTDKQTQTNDEASLRQKAKKMLQQRKAEEKLQAWTRQLRDESYVKTAHDS